MLKNNILLRILFLLMFYFIPFSILGQTYYVEFNNGNNSANGLTQQTAWKHCPGDANATGISASTVLIAGDTVAFKGGIEYKGAININHNGKADSYITFIGNSGWGIGRATFNMENTRQYSFKGVGDYIKIKGFNFYNYPVAGSDYVIYPFTNASYWDIDSCTIAFIEGWSNTKSMPDKAAILLSNGTSNITVQNCEFFANGRTAVRLRYTSNINILNNNFGGINRGDSAGYQSVSIRGEATSNNVFIMDNIFHDAWQYGGDQDPELNHSPAYLHIYGNTAGTEIPRNYTIDRNFFYTDKQMNTGTGTGSIEVETHCRNFSIRNNVIVNDIQWWGGSILVADRADSIWIENNTIINRDYTATNGGLFGIVLYVDPSSDPIGDSIWIKNNIFWNDDSRNYANIRFTTSASDFMGVLDNNAYFRPSGTSVGAGIPSPHNFATLQSFGFETNGQYYEIPAYGTGAWTYFENIPENSANSSSGDYSLSADAPIFLKSGGVDLSAYFTDDFEGNTRTNWTIGAIEYGNSLPDNTTPKLINALINNFNSVALTFSEPLNPATAQNVNNYIINNGVTVQSLVLSGSQVFLTTSDHSNGNYSITANNVTDLAGNTIDPNFNSYDYQYTSVDTIPPKLVSASVIDSITVDLYFSEMLDPITSQNIANYAINDINVSNALLSGNIVTLSTSIHNTGAYSVFVNNVSDNAENRIDVQHNSATYEFQPDPNSSLLMFPVSNVNASVTPEPQHYAEKTIDGNGYYDGDPESRWTGDTMPEWLVYDLGDVQILNSIKLSFYKWDEGRIYNFSIQVSSDSINWTTVKSNVSSSLEEWTIEEVGPIDARYIKVIFVSCNQLNWASLWEAEFWGQLKEPENPDDDEEIPVTFNLEQNYPNPFNPSTRIKVQLPNSANIKLTVYNMLGEFVNELANGEYEEGTYEFEFNALGLASGIYFYRIESSAFVVSKKMLLLR